MKNIDLGKTQITDTIRVSSAAIFYESWHGNYFQVETFIFKTDDNLKSQQIIHGTCSAEYPSEKLFNKAKKIHTYISNNLTKYYETINN